MSSLGRLVVEVGADFSRFRREFAAGITSSMSKADILRAMNAKMAVAEDALSATRINATRVAQLEAAKVTEAYARQARAATISAEDQAIAAAQVTQAEIRKTIAVEASTAKIVMAEKRVAAVSEETSLAMQRSSKRAAGSTGVAMLGAFTVAAAGVVAVHSLKMASSFEASMTRIRTQAHDTTDNIDQMGKQLLALAPKVGVGPQALTEAMYHVASAGYRGATAMNVLTQAMRLAKVGNADTTATANALVGILQSGIVGGANNAGKAVATMNAIIGSGNMTMDQFNAALSTGFASSARSFGVSLQSAGAALATLTDMGTPANSAATRLRMSMALLGAPTKLATKYLMDIGLASGDAGHRVSAMQLVLQKAGVQTTQLANDMRKPDGFMMALGDLKAHMVAAGISANEQSAMISRAFGGGRSGAAIMALYQRLDLLNQKFHNITAGSHSFGSDWTKTQATFKQQVDQMHARLQAMFVQLGTFLIPIATKALQGLGKAFDWLGQHKEVLAGIGGALAGIAVAGGVAAAAFLGPMIAAVAPFLLIGAAVGVLAYELVHLYQNSEAFRNKVNQVGEALKSALGASINWLVHTAFPALQGAWKATWQALNSVIEWFITGPLSWIKTQIAYFNDWWRQHGQQLITVVKYIWNFIWGIIKITFIQIQMIFKIALAGISAVWTFTWHQLWNTLKIVWNLVKDTVAFNVHWIMNVIGIFLDLLTGHWSQAWHDLKHLVSQGFTDIRNLVGHFASGALHMLYQAGTDLIHGFVNGIKATLGAVGSAVKDAGKTAIDTAKNLLGIHSPSAVFHNIGLNVGDGLANGISASLPAVQAAAERLAVTAAQAAQTIVTQFNSAMNAIASKGASLPKAAGGAITPFLNLLPVGTGGYTMPKGPVIHPSQIPQPHFHLPTFGGGGGAGGGGGGAGGGGGGTGSGSHHAKAAKKHGVNVGLWLTAGIVDGITKSTSSLISTMDHQASLMQKSAEWGALRVVQTWKTRLLTLSTELGKVTQQLAAAQADWLAKVDASKKYADQIAANYNTSVLTSSARGIGASFSDVIGAMQKQVAAASAMQEVIAKLKSEGLNATTLDQIASSPDSLGVAQRIAAQGTAGVAQLNALQTQLGVTSKAVGQTAADALYASGISAAHGLVVGLQKEHDTISASLLSAAQATVRAIAAAIDKTPKGLHAVHPPAHHAATHHASGHHGTTATSVVHHHSYAISINPKNLAEFNDIVAFTKRMQMARPTIRQTARSGSTGA